MGNIGLHRAGIIELPPRMRPTEDLLHAAKGENTVLASKRIRVEITGEVLQEFHRSITLSADRVVIRKSLRSNRDLRPSAGSPGIGFAGRLVRMGIDDTRQSATIVTYGRPVERTC